MAANYLIPYSVIFLSALVLLVLVTKPKTYFKANRYLAVSISIFFLFFLYNFLVRLQVIFYVPHLYRAITPLYLLIGPFTFFYVRSVLADKTQLTSRDWWHFLPFVLMVIEMLPFYLETAAEKTARMRLVFTSTYGDTQAEGFFNTQQHNIIQALSLIGYGVAIWLRVRKFKKRHPAVVTGPFKRWFQWIRLYYWFMIVPFSLAFMLITISFFVPIGQLYTINYFVLCIFFALVLAALFFYPSVLYGLPKWEQKSPEPTSSAEPTRVTQHAAQPQPELKRTGVTDERMEKIAHEIDFYLTYQQPFLKQGFALADLASELDYSPHLVSAVINRHHEKRFNELINDYRVQYIVQHSKTNKNWQNLTLEAIAAEAGFSTRATFISAFKKSTGKTPSQFFAATYQEVE